MNSALLGNAVRIVIAPDKFEGSLSAGQAAPWRAAAWGFRAPHRAGAQARARRPAGRGCRPERPAAPRL